MGCGATSARYQSNPDGPSYQASLKAVDTAVPVDINPEGGDSAGIALGGQWYYEAALGEWHPMDAEVSAQLLVAWHCGESHVTYCMGSIEFDVDLTSCVQTHQKSGVQQRIGYVANDQDQDQLDEECIEDEASEGNWVEYDEDDMQQLLAAWASGSSIVRYTSHGCEYELDFTKMLQTNLTTGAQQYVGVEMMDDSDAALHVGEQQSQDWMQYIDAGSGKPYYYNGQTTTWEKPSGHGVRIFTAEDYANDTSASQYPDSLVGNGETEFPVSQHDTSATMDHVKKEPTKLDVPQKPAKKYSLNRDPPPQATQSSQDRKQVQQTRFYTPEAPPFNPDAATRYNPSADWHTPWQPTEHRSQDPKLNRRPDAHEQPSHDGSTFVPQAPPNMPHSRPQARFYKTADPNRPRPKQREKKYTLGPEKTAPRTQPPQPKQMPRPQPGQPPFTHASTPQPETTPPRTEERPTKQPPKPIELPIGAEWPGDPKARKVAETLFKDMCISRDKPLKERQKAYRASCLSWHPDKNPKYIDLSTEVFKFLQVLKQWYFEEHKEQKVAT